MNPPNSPSTTWLDRLEKKAGAQWGAIRKAQEDTKKNRENLKAVLSQKIAPDTTLVLFGSIAREEMTSGSDPDWLLLVDGQAVPEHLNQRHAINEELTKLGYPKPGESGVFGRMVGSHDIVHDIGGEDDTNSNTTRRVLLLLESFPVGNREAYDRVRRQVLSRYLGDDRGLRYSDGPFKIPRFLLNDLTRYWRTITVDFVYKQRAEAGQKWALRNAKLRMSRKLIFASGLLRCFFCHLDPEAAHARQALSAPTNDISKLLTYIENQLSWPPLELLARAASRPDIDLTTPKKLFDSYNQFLAVLDDQKKRDELKTLGEDQMTTSPVWQEIRGLSHDFHNGLIELFFGKDAALRELSVQYAVF
jgi:predicted nucleotidyltransferase